MLTYGRGLDYEVGAFTNPESIPNTQISNLELRYGNSNKVHQKSPKHVKIKLPYTYVIQHTL